MRMRFMMSTAVYALVVLAMGVASHFWVEREQEFEGSVFVGFESFYFENAKDHQQYWIESAPISAGFTKLGKPSSLTEYKVKIKGKPHYWGRYGHLSHYERGMDVTEILQKELITAP